MTVERISVGDVVTNIEGWGLNNPDEYTYELRETGRYFGQCQSDTCAHNSHDPYGPVMRLTLRTSLMPESEVRPGTPNKIIYLGETGDDSSYTGPYQGKLLRVRFTMHYNEYAAIVPLGDVPISIEEAYFSV